MAGVKQTVKKKNSKVGENVLNSCWNLVVEELTSVTTAHWKDIYSTKTIWMFHLQQELHYVAKKRFEYVDKYVFGGHFLTVSRLKVHPGVKLSCRQSSKPG